MSGSSRESEPETHSSYSTRALNQERNLRIGIGGAFPQVHAISLRDLVFSNNSEREKNSPRLRCPSVPSAAVPHLTLTATSVAVVAHRGRVQRG